MNTKDEKMLHFLLSHVSKVEENPREAYRILQILSKKRNKPNKSTLSTPQQQNRNSRPSHFMKQVGSRAQVFIDSTARASESTKVCVE